jgi:hypothetical protein
VGIDRRQQPLHHRRRALVRSVHDKPPPTLLHLAVTDTGVWN